MYSFAVRLGVSDSRWDRRPAGHTAGPSFDRRDASPTGQHQPDHGSGGLHPPLAKTTTAAHRNSRCAAAARLQSPTVATVRAERNIMKASPPAALPLVPLLRTYRERM